MMEDQKIDMMNQLPDDLLIKILSSLSVKECVTTALLSKRWNHLWKRVPNLKYGDHSFTSYPKFSKFVYKSLSLSEVPVLTSLELDLKLGLNSDVSDIDAWFETASNRSVSEVRINSFDRTFALLCGLSTCGTLKTLILHQVRLEDVVPSFRLHSLKTLHLLMVEFGGSLFVKRLFEICPILEDLVVRRGAGDDVETFTIDIPSLRNLTVDNLVGVLYTGGFVIKAPSLKYFCLTDISNFLKLEPMPDLVQAKIDASFNQSENLMESLTSVRHLFLCCDTSQDLYTSGTFFLHLEHLELCTCTQTWYKTLLHLLEHAPRLRVLKLKRFYDLHHYKGYKELEDWWTKPSYVPECLSSYLEIFEWRYCKLTEQEIKMAKYILANASRLKMATFASNSAERHQMFKNVGSLPIGSKACQLVFK